MSRVRGVLTTDTGRDISEEINHAGSGLGFDPVGFLGGLIAESNLKEQAFRDRDWPDKSWGLAQQTLKWVSKFVPNIDRAPDGTGIDSPANRARMQEYFWDASRAIAYAAPIYAVYVKRTGDPVDAWCLWNKPSIEPRWNANRPAYARGYELAKAYAVPEEETPMPDHPDLGIKDLRGQLPVLRDRGNHWQQMDYSVRSLSEIDAATVHYTASPPGATVANIASYQISDQAIPQTGVDQPFPGIAYHYVVDGAGVPHRCWDLGKRTWHAPGHNDDSLAICFIGDRAPSPAQVLGIAKCHVDAEWLLGWALAVRGHKDDYATSCPGGWPDWKPDLVAQIETLRGESSPAPAPAPIVPSASDAIGELDNIRQLIRPDFETWTRMVQILINGGSEDVTVRGALDEIYRITEQTDAKMQTARAMVDIIKRSL